MLKNWIILSTLTILLNLEIPEEQRRGSRNLPDSILFNIIPIMFRYPFISQMYACRRATISILFKSMQIATNTFIFFFKIAIRFVYFEFYCYFWRRV